MKIILKLLILLSFIQGILMGAEIKHINIKGIKIPVVYEKSKNLPILNLQLVFKNSGYMQDGDKSGLASISAKLLNEGTKELGTNKFAQKLENLAISLDINHGFETFVIEISSLKEVSKDSFSLLSKLLKDPNYDEKVLNKIKTLKIGSLKRKENDYDYIASNNLKELIFKDTPLENPSSGTIESISHINLKDIKKFIDNTLDLNNLIVVVGGDFSFKELEKELGKLLSSLNSKKANKLKEVSVSSKSDEIIVEKDTQQAYIYFGSPFDVSVNDKDVYMAKVASFILGGSGFGSRLMEEIRVKRGLAYSAYGYVSVNRSYSYFTGYLQTKLESANEAKTIVKTLVDEFVKKGVTQKELDSAKKFLLGSEPLRTETLSQRLNRAFTLFYRGLDQDYTEKELKNIESLELEDLNKYIKSHKEINELSFSIVRK